LKISIRTFFTLAVFSSITLVQANAEGPLPNSVTIIPKEDLVGHPYFSVADALKDVASLNLETDGYRGTKSVAKIRGGSSEKAVDVLIDGESVSDSFDGTVDLSQIPINIVERIEISRGGAPASWGV
jgi:outer membrane cobalamin receptor